MDGERVLAKVLVVYESKYGNTKRVAEAIAEGIKDEGKLEVSVKEVKGVKLEEVTGYDVILIGSPNHIGGPTRAIRGFIDKLGKMQLKGKMFAVFDTYMGRDFEKAVNKMERRISEKIPGIQRLAHGLSVRVEGMRGPIADGELQRCRDFGKMVAAQIKPS